MIALKILLSKKIFINRQKKKMKKISLKDVKNGLKRDEMRMLVGGGCGRTPGCGETCTSDSFCSSNTSCPCCTNGECAKN
jgi:hypothetical protein